MQILQINEGKIRDTDNIHKKTDLLYIEIIIIFI